MIDLGERAVLSVLVQRGGKLPEWKRVNGALRLPEDVFRDFVLDGEATFILTGDAEWFRDPPQLVRQFNSATIGDLVGRGYARRRVDRVRRVRIVEITDAGRKALAAWRE